MANVKLQAQVATRKQLNDELDRKLPQMREHMKALSDEENRTKMMQLEESNANLRTRLTQSNQEKDSATRTAQQLERQLKAGTPAIIGAVGELDLEARLCSAQAFRGDRITRVSKAGAGDLLLEVMHNGRLCGTVLIENKRTQTWGGDWVANLKRDMRIRGAAVGVIVTAIMPRGNTWSVELEPNLWAFESRCAIQHIAVLRRGVVEAAMQRGFREGAQEKQAILYDYLTGPRFRLRMNTIFDRFRALNDSIRKLRNTANKLWAEEDQCIIDVFDQLSAMSGEMETISGKRLGVQVAESEAPAPRQLPPVQPDDEIPF
jgi:hypothetical protein